MNRTLKAADDVRKLHRMFLGLGEVIAVLDDLGSVEQAENEARVRTDALNDLAEALKIEVDAARAEAERIRAEAKAYAADVKAQADMDAQDIRINADAYAKVVKGAAQEEANARITQADEEARAVMDKARALTADVERKAAELAGIEDKLAKARAQIAKLLD